MRTRHLLPLVALIVVTTPGAARANGATLAVAPEGGGPGTQVVLTGTGFCARPDCSTVTFMLQGAPFAPEVRPGAGGGFAQKATLPGGLLPGELQVQATQQLADGTERVARAAVLYSPSRGEEAEREAETRDFVSNLVNPSNPAPPPRGVPLVSAVPDATDLPTSASSTATSAAQGSATDARDRDDASRRWTWLVGLPVALVLAAGTALLLARRRRTHLEAP